MEENPDAFVTQMNTVYNDETNGPFLQTSNIACANILFGIYHERKTALSVKQSVFSDGKPINRV